MAEVSLENVWKIYEDDGYQAVKGVSLDIRDREFMVLVGPSGCGKSTTLRMIAGLEDICRGTIRIGDTVVNDIPPKQRDIAMVFQNYALYPHMSVFDNMAFGLKLRKFPKAEIQKRVMEAARILGLEPYLDRRPKALSGGQRQRVAVGRAIVRKPKAFLFDEPLSNLDAKMRVQMRIEISKLHHQLESTMIYVTHDQTEAMTMGDRICVMKDGVIQQVADPLTLYSRPANQFVGGFIGTPPMNFFNGRLEQSGERLCFASEGMTFTLPEAWKDKAAKAAGPDVVFGIRPENLVIADDGMAAVIEVRELMGAETYLHLRLGGHTFVARVAPETGFHAGDTVKFRFDTAKAHLFEQESGRAL